MSLMSIPAELKYVIFSILFVLASVNFTRTAMDILQNSKRLEDLHSDVATLQKKHDDLTASIAYKKSADYIEERARDALDLIKPNEQVYVVAQTQGVLAAETVAKPAVTVASHSSESYFKQWLQLFFN